ncbi:ABC transporter ATP-binding protein [Lentimicrobium sp. S6]|uniref:ABC transporter ATP-binding protein n=1 Tax=unclassified Lentimicrobium TaxID=2677434 RepID=UPI00352C5832
MELQKVIVNNLKIQVMLNIKQISKEYSGETVLNIPQLEIKKGESFGLVGNNGAGKTTLFRLILDLIKAHTGEIYSKDTSVAGSEHWKAYTGSYLDEGFLIDFLTAEEYFEFVGAINGLSKGDIEDFMKGFEPFFDGEVLGKKKYIRDFSKGNQKKIGITAAIMTQPEVLILDEPFSNLDPSTQIRLKKLLRSMQEDQKVTMLISSHDLNHVTEVCDRIVVLDKGELVHDIKTSESTLKDLESYFSVE